MPRYTYRCDKCENILEIVHSIKEKLETCEECKGSLIRVPSEAFINFKQTAKEGAHKIGDVVKNHIEESRKELKQEKQKIEVKEYK